MCSRCEFTASCAASAAPAPPPSHPASAPPPPPAAPAAAAAAAPSSTPPAAPLSAPVGTTGAPTGSPAAPVASEVAAASLVASREEAAKAAHTARATFASWSTLSPPSWPMPRESASAAAVASATIGSSSISAPRPLSRGAPPGEPTPGPGGFGRTRAPFCCWRSLAATCSTRPGASMPSESAGIIADFCRFNLRSSRRSAEFQWFLIALSVRPTSSLAMSAHRFPRLRCASKRIRSSSGVQTSFLIAGSSWLCQRSRHCFPVRPWSCAAISDHRFVPWLSTSPRTV